MANEAALAEAFVKRKIRWLAENRNESAAKAMLARLRRGIGKKPGSMPELWPVTMEGLPEALMGRESDPSQGEWAVYVSLTLFALHQQGKEMKVSCMSREGMPLGSSVRRLAAAPDDEQRVKRRFDAAATSESTEEFAHHLRGLVQLLKSKDIPLDYPALAKDLYYFQSPEARDAVRLRWGRDFYRYADRNAVDTEPTEKGKEDEHNEK